MKYAIIFIAFLVIGCGNEPISQDFKAQLFHANLIASNKIEISYENDGHHALKFNIEKDQSFECYSAIKGKCKAELILDNQELSFYNVNNKIGPFKLEGNNVKLIQGKNVARNDGSILLGTYQNTKNKEVEISVNLVRYK